MAPGFSTKMNRWFSRTEPISRALFRSAILKKSGRREGLHLNKVKLEKGVACADRRAAHVGAGSSVALPISHLISNSYKAIFKICTSLKHNTLEIPHSCSLMVNYGTYSPLLLRISVWRPLTNTSSACGERGGALWYLKAFSSHFTYFSTSYFYLEKD